MNDALQATAPCFLKLEFGCGGATSYVSIWVTLGTGTNGAGTLTGVVGTRVQIYGNSNSASLFNSKFSIANNRLMTYMWPTAAALYWFLAIERTHDASGADNAIGIMMFISSQYGSGTQTILYSGAPTVFYSAYWNVVMPPGYTTAAYGSDVFLFPVRSWAQGETSPSNQFMVYFTSDLTQNNVTPVKMWDGVIRPMIPVTWLSAMNYGGGSCNLAIRFD
jgi:hypothetical protein